MRTDVFDIVYEYENRDNDDKVVVILAVVARSLSPSLHAV